MTALPVSDRRAAVITYRDEQTYRETVLGGPLFPSIAHAARAHLARLADRLNSDRVTIFTMRCSPFCKRHSTPGDVHHAIAATSEDWDTLAHAANWARRSAGILEDTHWLGGDPQARGLRLGRWSAQG